LQADVDELLGVLGRCGQGDPDRDAKLGKLFELVQKKHPGQKIIIFTQHNHLVYRLSRMFLIPAITHATSKEERAEIIEAFRQSTSRVLVTSKVLDEGIDVPDASLGIILSGTGSKREFVQRLGRLLRKVEGKEAKLIEVISRSTAEARVSSRRRGDL